MVQELQSINNNHIDHELKPNNIGKVVIQAQKKCLHKPLKQRRQPSIQSQSSTSARRIYKYKNIKSFIKTTKLSEIR